MPVKPTLTLCLIALAGLCHADADPAAEEEIPNIIVSTTRSPQTRELTPISVEVISRAEIERSGAPHVADLLRTVGATQVQDNYGDGSRTTVSMRGFGATAGANTLIMIDGRRLNNSDLAPPDLNGVAVRDVERVEILQGSSAVLFGDQAVGGVVNVITRTPGEPHLELVSGLSSYGGTSAAAVFDQPFAERFNLRLMADTRRSDGYRDSNELSLSDVRAQLTHASELGSSFLEMQRVSERIELPGALTLAQLSDDRTQAQFATDFASTTTETARVGSVRMLTERLTFLGEWTHRDSHAHGALSGGTRFEQQRRSRSLNPRLEWAGDSLLMTSGVDLERNDYGLTSLFGGFPSTTNSRQEISSGYVQVIAPLDRVLNATLGVRVARMSNRFADSFAGRGDVNATARAYELGVSYRPSGELRAHLRYAGSFRFPKSDELTFTGVDHPILQTQTGDSIEGGLTWVRGDLSVSALAYRLLLEQEIGFDPLADIGFGFFGANNNLDDTERSGVLLSLKWQATPHLSFATRIDRLSARFTAGPFERRTIPNVSESLAHASMTYTSSKGITLYLDAQYSGPRYADGDFANEQSREGAQTLVNGNITLSRGAWTFALRGDNLTDRRYSEYVALRWDGIKTYYPSPERRFRFDVGYRF